MVKLTQAVENICWHDLQRYPALLWNVPRLFGLFFKSRFKGYTLGGTHDAGPVKKKCAQGKLIPGSTICQPICNRHSLEEFNREERASPAEAL